MFQHSNVRRFTCRLVGLALVLAMAVPALAAPSGVVNVNDAQEQQLMLLPRVGPSLAARIVEHRDEHGDFEDPSDLMLVRGIGEKSFAAMEPFVAVEGETTLDEKVRLSRLASDKSDEDR